MPTKRRPPSRFLPLISSSIIGPLSSEFVGEFSVLCRTLRTILHMQRALLIAAVCVACLSGWPCIAEQQQSDTHTASYKATQAQGPVPPTHVVIDQPIPGSTVPPAKTAETPERPLPRFIRPEWVIVYVTIAYAWVAWRTLRAISKQSDTMERQSVETRSSSADAAITAQSTLNAIQRQASSMEEQAALMKMQLDIQGAGMQQWVDIEPIKVDHPKDAAMKDPIEINLHFEATNNTPYPLTVEKVVTQLSFFASEWKVSTVEASVRLPPTRNGKSSAYAFYAPVLVNGGAKWLNHGAIVTVNGDVFFRDCMNREQVQYFGGLYRCTRGEFVYLKPLGIVPTTATRTEPNTGLG